ncbi:MAG: glycosyltransferase family 39 protein [Bacteroidia bacterium]
MEVGLYSVFKDFRIWLFVFFALRLIGITDPPLEISHNWRQVTVNMIARNFSEDNAPFLYPEMDNAGEKSGITGTEFPLLNWLISLMANIFGWQHWYGRLINLLVTSLGIWYFYKWLKDFVKEDIAFPAGMILIVSLWFSFSRKIMPDTFSMSLAFIGLYYGYKYLQSKGLKNILLFTFFGTLGVLCKVPAILALSPLLIEYIYSVKKTKVAHLPILIAGAFILSINFYWYFIWFNDLIRLGEWQFYYMGPGFPAGLTELFIDLNETFDNIYFESLKFSGFLLFIIGLILAWLKKAEKLIYIFLLWGFGFFLFMVQAGYGYATHDYYTIPFVPAMAIIAGYGISQIPGKISKSILLSIIVIEGIANQQHDFRIKDTELYKLELAEICNNHFLKDDLILVNTGQNPQSLYFCNRKGWTVEHESINDVFIDSLSQLGLKGLIFDKRKGTVELKRDRLYEDENYVVYSISTRGIKND